MIDTGDEIRQLATAAIFAGWASGALAVVSVTSAVYGYMGPPWFLALGAASFAWDALLCARDIRRASTALDRPTLPTK